jgi:phage/plasmid primase-like uncharacterized protein
MIPATDIERARAVKVEDEITRRGITLRRVGAELNGACPLCGGSDRFALHVTYLRPDGSGNADIPKLKQKASFGPVSGGAVRFGMPRGGKWLAIGEGIETTLSVVHACGLAGWAALSEGGIRRLVLPPEATHVLICADHDANGVGRHAACEAAERFLREGRRVHVAIPPVVGSDFNDVLNSAAPTHLEGESRDVA